MVIAGSSDSSVVRAADSWSKGPGFESLQEWWENFLLLCWLLFWYLFHPCVTAVTRKRSRSFCQKCRWQVIAKHTHTLPMWLWKMWHCKLVHGVHKTLAKTAAVSCGTSHAATKQRCQYTITIKGYIYAFKIIIIITIQNHMWHECSESAQEQRLVLYIYIYIYIYINQSINQCCLVILVTETTTVLVLVSYWGENEHMYSMCTDAMPHTTEDHKLFKQTEFNISSIKTHHNQHIQCREAHENLEWGRITVSDVQVCFCVSLTTYYSIVICIIIIL